MKINKIMTACAIGALTLSLLTGCGASGKDSDQTSGTPMFPQNNGTKESITSVGEFTTTGIDGEEYTSDIFKDYDLTLVNIFATWCGPCINEMPELEEFRKEMNPKGVNVIAIVLDSVDEDGEVIEDAVDSAKQLQKKADLGFPILIPDSTNMNGRLEGIEAIPESFFVDKDGNIVGQTYVGARDLEEWIKVAEKELADLK